MDFDFKVTSPVAITIASILVALSIVIVIAQAATIGGKSKSQSQSHPKTVDSTMKRLVPRLDPKRTLLFVCDIQDRFRTLIFKSESLISRTALVADACRVLKVPLIVTEQVPRVFGATVPDLQCTPAGDDCAIFDKKKFSMLTPQVATHWRASHPERTQVLLCGIEAHVCVLHTALDVLLERPDTEVFVVCDAVSSQRPHDRAVALERMRAAGAVMTTAESCLFDLMRSAEHPDFKAVSALLKAANTANNEFADESAL